MSFRNLAVCEPLTLATSSGVPVAMIWPPPLPPSGPRSTIQSAVLITSKLCSITPPKKGSLLLHQITNNNLQQMKILLLGGVAASCLRCRSGRGVQTRHLKEYQRLHLFLPCRGREQDVAGTILQGDVHRYIIRKGLALERLDRLVMLDDYLIELSVSKELGGKPRLSELCITSSAVPPLST